MLGEEVRTVLQLAVGCVFSLSVAGKLADVAGFFHGIRQYALVPQSLVGPAGWLIIVAECCVVLTHISGIALGTGAIVALCLLTTFAIAVAITLKRGGVIPCYCHGTGSEEEVSSRTLLRIGGLLFVEILILMAVGPVSTIASTTLFRGNSEDVIGTVVWVLAVLHGSAWCLRLTDVGRMWRRIRRV